MDKDKNPIQFQPITSGLGFHPFSDGLPYAPVSPASKPRPKAAPLDPKPQHILGRAHALPGHLERPAPRPTSTQSAPAGAVAAGRATFAYPAQMTRQGVSPAENLMTRQGVSPAENLMTRQGVSPAETLLPVSQFGALYVCKRALAFILDTVVNCGLLAVGLGLSLVHQGLDPEIFSNLGILLLAFVFFALFSWAATTAQEIAFGTSFGKRVFGLALTGSATAILVRALLFIPSAGLCGAGLLWAIVDPRCRCWHDLVTRLQPTEIARL